MVIIKFFFYSYVSLIVRLLFIFHVLKYLLFVEAPGYLIDLMHDKNPAIRKVCDACLDVIAVSTFPKHS